MHANKERLITMVRDAMQKWHVAQPPDRGPIGAYCLWWAYYTCIVLNRNGLRAQLQAGTAYWPCATPEQDDGDSPNHFGYQYTPSVQNAVTTFAGGTLPEIHVWAAIAPTQEIIDPTTMYWPMLAQRLNVKWPGPPPPPYFWGRAADLPRGVSYLPNMEAIALCYTLLKATK